MKARMKKAERAPALDVPQSDDEANALLLEYGECFNEAARIEAAMNDELSALKVRFEQDAAPHQARMMQIYDALNAFGGAHRKRLTDDGKRKTVQLPAGEMGWRWNPASVRLKRGRKAEEVVETIRAKGRAFAKFLRISLELNKEAMLDDPETACQIDGITIGRNGEKFFVAPFGAKLAEPKA